MNESADIRNRLIEINQIFDELIEDALGLSNDLVSSIKQWLLSSAFWFLATILFFWYVMYPKLISIENTWILLSNWTFYLDGFLVLLFAFLGCVSLWRYRVLKKKYARLFAIHEALSKEK